MRDFAKSTGQLAKNDRLDAQVLAHFGEAIHPPMRALRDADTQVFGPMLARRRQVVAILVAETIVWVAHCERYVLVSRPTSLGWSRS